MKVVVSQQVGISGLGLPEYGFTSPYDYLKVAVNEYFWERHANTMAYNPYSDQPDDTYLDYREVLISIMEACIPRLTAKQQAILKLHLSGMEQEEIGLALGIHQTTVHKALYGNIDYARGGIRYGGIVRKLGKLILQELSARGIKPPVSNSHST